MIQTFHRFAINTGFDRGNGHSYPLILIGFAMIFFLLFWKYLGEQLNGIFDLFDRRVS